MSSILKIRDWDGDAEEFVDIVSELVDDACLLRVHTEQVVMELKHALEKRKQ